jgi:uncharacterized protein
MFNNWKLIKPNLILAQPVWFLTEEILDKHGLKGLILDVDDTLLGNDEVDISTDVVQWMEHTKKTRQIWLISNNFSDIRIKRIAESLGVPYRSRAAKPSRRAIREALEAMKLQPSQVAMVGDRVLTDTVAGNRLGLFTILILPPSITKPTSWMGGRTAAVRQWESWLIRKTGISL